MSASELGKWGWFRIREKSRCARPSLAKIREELLLPATNECVSVNCNRLSPPATFDNIPMGFEQVLNSLQ